MIVSLATPQILRVRASRGDDPEPTIDWTVRLGDFEYERNGVRGDKVYLRPFVGHLRVDGASAWGDIDVTSLLVSNEATDFDEVMETIETTDAIETLYRFARATLAPLVLGLDDSAAIPEFSPAATVEKLELSDEEPDSGDAPNPVD
ncbi:hypothetical protein [Microbacterium sp. Leaf179]|uniref:hypothetical protein n=1 Tax=Microbacterium sp. Leaf179 TaxID=1736288 RepID=UPI0012E39ACD|nr:hypothetical protein [Microbacterium sp. Leaf179]